MQLEEKESGAATHSKNCPVHHVRPLVSFNNDQITIRCCCDYFTQEYMSYLYNKLKGNTIADLLGMWEKDLQLSELEGV